MEESREGGGRTERKKKEIKQGKENTIDTEKRPLVLTRFSILIVERGNVWGPGRWLGG